MRPPPFKDSTSLIPFDLPECEGHPRRAVDPARIRWIAIANGEFSRPAMVAFP